MHQVLLPGFTLWFRCYFCWLIIFIFTINSYFKHQSKKNGLIPRHFHFNSFSKKLLDQKRSQSLLHSYFVDTTRRLKEIFQRSWLQGPNFRLVRSELLLWTNVKLNAQLESFKFPTKRYSMNKQELSFQLNDLSNYSI